MTNNLNPVPKKMDKVAVLVLGMHRSGTSMLGGILDRLGCQGPKSVMKPSEDNPKGYFESSELMRLNDEVLNVLGARWDGWQPFDPGWQNSRRFAEFRERIAEAMAAEYGNASLIYLKDPRICRLLPLWREALVDIGYSLVCIHTHRNPIDVCRSLAARKGNEVGPELGMLVWLRHVLDAEAASRGLPRIFTSYARILANWNEFSDRAEAAFGFSWPVPEKMRDVRLRDIIDHSLRHHDSSVENLLRDSSKPELFKDCLRVMEQWTESGEDEAGREVLTQIADRFEASATLFSGPMLELSTKCRALRGQGAGHEAQIRELKGREVEQQKVLEAQAQKFEAALAQEREAFAARETATHEELRQANDCYAQLRAESDQMAAKFRADLATALAEAKDAESRLNDVQQLYSALQKENAFVGETLNNARQLNEKMQGEAEKKIKGLDDEVRTFTSKLIERDKAVIKLNREMAALRKSADERVTKASNELAAFRKSADKQIAALKLESKLAKERIDSLHEEYRSSTSWKISAPVRAIGRRIRPRG